MITFLQKRQHGRYLTVIVSNAECVLPLLLCGSSTADMVAFTGRTMIALYPKLTSQRVAIPTGRIAISSSPYEFANIQAELDNIGVQFVPSNEDWTCECGAECPSLVRSVTENVGLFHLTEHPVDRVLEQWEVSEAQWSLGWNCSNSSCRQCFD